MHQPTYRNALKAGWQLAWHHKSLWVFGLFAALLGQLGIVELLTKLSLGANGTGIFSGMVYLSNVFVGFPFTAFSSLDLSYDKWVWFVWLAIIFVGFFIMLVYISIISQGAIVHSAARFMDHKGKKFEHSRVSWHESRLHFWKLLVLNIIRKVVEVAFLLFVLWGMVNAVINPSVGDSVLFLVLFVLAIAMGAVLSFLLIYAIGYVVTERQGVWEAIRNAWRLFTDHWFVSIEVGLVVVMINIVFVLFVLVGMYLLFLPSLVLWYISAVLQNTFLYSLGVGLGLILLLTYAAFLISILNVFVISTWTYLFSHMHHKGLKSRMFHWFGH